MIVALGWTLLFSAPQLASLLASASARSMSAGSLDIASIAACAILSGFGIAILGALQTGFGALSRFFETILVRTAPAASKAAASQSGLPRKIIERGWVKDRAYVLFADGSVEVETMLGRRLFPSLQDAQEFIA
jgi:prepilin-type processing-associated H-X9-DG protein